MYDVIEGGIFYGTLDRGKPESTVRQSCDFTSFFPRSVCACASSSGVAAAVAAAVVGCAGVSFSFLAPLVSACECAFIIFFLL